MGNKAAGKGIDRDALKVHWNQIDFENTDQSLKVAAPPVHKDWNRSAALVELPSIETLSGFDRSFFDCMRSRKSRRKYSSQPLSAKDLSLLLWATQGLRELKPKYSFRAVPSAGARHPLETYLYLDLVEGIIPGFYRYLPEPHKLLPLDLGKGATKEALHEALMDQLYGAAVVFAWSAIPYRTEWRYSIASPKLVAIDAGHVCQNLYLACEAAGCGACAIGAYDQTAMDALFGLDGVDEFVLYCATVGKIEN